MKNILIATLYRIVKVLVDSQIVEELTELISVYMEFGTEMTGEEKSQAVDEEMEDVLAELSQIGITISSSMLNMAKEIVYNYLKNQNVH